MIIYHIDVFGKVSVYLTDLITFMMYFSPGVIDPSLFIKIRV